ncbi:MAG: glycosyltransferase family 4 protein [Flavobacteriales bacterium]|nr:glycosyltransferase family 4 protein [Flavobacteriales bacterium]MCB9363348.1 glycosyltransferase family 4 protein [Flavobacteriales bacterium]
MKIYINGRFLTQRPTGVQFYAQEFCKEIESVIDFEILVPKKQEIVNQSLNHKIKKVGNLKGYLWEQISLPNFIKKEPNSILINLCNLAPISLNNQIITIHDLAFIENRKWFSMPFQKVYNFIIPRIVKNSLAIITVSETIKKEIITHFKINETKVNVVYNKVSADLIKAIPCKPNINITSNDFYLMVGSNNPRKNFAFVEEIFFTQLKHKKIVLVGADHSSFNTENSINNDNIVRLKNASVNEIAWLYKNTIALINPSFYEGFGIPNIEAMYFKTPILCSNIPVFKEVCSNYASYFELGNESDFITHLNAISLENNANTNLDFFQNQNRVDQIKKILNL